MTKTIERKGFRLVVPSGNATVNIVEDNETERGSVVNYWPTRPTEPTRYQWMKLIENSGSFEFWTHPDEDIYTEEDAEPV